jgi:hypothetical protein
MPRTESEESRNLAAALAASLDGLTRQLSATASQVISDSSLRRISSKPEFLCKICYCNDPIGDGSTSIALPCGHRWHKDCLLGMIKSKVADSQLEILCPDVPTDVDERALLDNADEVGCETLITKEMIFDLAAELGDDELPATFERFEEMISDPHVRECPRTECNHRQKGNPRRPKMQCEACDQQYCFAHATAHPSTQSCASYERQQRSATRANQQFVKGTTLNCPACKKPTTKAGGCNHMTCSECQAHWCWVCVREIKRGQVSKHYAPHNWWGCPGMQMVDKYPLYHRHLLYGMRMWYLPLGIPLMIAVVATFGSIWTVNAIGTAFACCPCVACFWLQSREDTRDKLLLIGALSLRCSTVAGAATANTTLLSLTVILSSEQRFKY